MATYRGSFAQSCEIVRPLRRCPVSSERTLMAFVLAAQEIFPREWPEPSLGSKKNKFVIAEYL